MECLLGDHTDFDCSLRFLSIISLCFRRGLIYDAKFLQNPGASHSVDQDSWNFAKTLVAFVELAFDFKLEKLRVFIWNGRFVLRKHLKSALAILCDELLE